MLVVWGLFAQEMGLIERFEQVNIKQKTRVHPPQMPTTPNSRNSAIGRFTRRGLSLSPVCANSSR
jgi:hypothetical protein